MLRKFAALVAASAVALTAPCVSADIIEVNFVLSGQQEVPANNSNAAGAAQLLYDTVTQTYDLDLMVFGIALADLTASPVHFHIAPPGVNGPIVVDVGSQGSFVNSGLGIRLQITGAPFATGGSNPTTNEAALFAGNMYLNVHTNAFPGGQIRGQVVPIPAPGAVALLAIAGLVGARRRRDR